MMSAREAGGNHYEHENCSLSGALTRGGVGLADPVYLCFALLDARKNSSLPRALFNPRYLCFCGLEDKPIS